MSSSAVTLGLCAAALLFGSHTAHAETRVSYDQALSLAREGAPTLALARATESVAEADSRTTSLYPNPSINGGTATQTARLSVGASLPLLVLGQRGAALRAGRADFAVTKFDTITAWVDARAATGHAFVGLWLAERTAEARADAAGIAQRLATAVAGRVELGSAPELEGLLARSERLRMETAARVAADLVDASAADLAAWIGLPMSESLRVSGAPQVPTEPPALAELWSGVDRNPTVRRAAAEVLASEAHVTSERAQLRPLMTLDVGADLHDPTLPGTNYRAQLSIEVPLLNQRGPFIEREERRAVAARSKVQLEKVRSSSALMSAYRSFVALTRQVHTLGEAVLPTAVAAARATEESYALGRAPLVTVLDAERARIDAGLTLIESQAARANAWIDVEQALGVQ